MDALDRFQSGLFFHQVNKHHALGQVPGISRREYSRAEPIYSAKNTYNRGANLTPSVPAHDESSTSRVSLPLLGVSVDVDINGRLCTTKVTQQFSNASSSVAENTTYIFPVYDGSSITSFRCSVGNDKLLEGVVKAKEAARAEFQNAVSHHKVAILVEELDPEILETNVGNIPGQTTVKVEITYVSLLKVDNSTGGLVLTIPTSIAPRYGVAPEGYKENQSLLVEGLRVNIQASMPAAIRKMESRTHPISVEMGAVAHNSFDHFAAGASSEAFDLSKGRATLADTSAVLDRDFVLYILSNSRESTKSQALTATQNGQSNATTIAVSIHPRDLFLQNVNTEAFDGEIIFVADRSGSMGPKIPSLINVMNIFLRSLPQKCSFNIASFGSSFASLWPASQKYCQKNLDEASKHIQSFTANFGGTEIYGALQNVLLQFNKKSRVPTSVILLTDGEVWNVDDVIQLVKDTISNHELNLRFFSIGIGDQVSHRLIEGIGQQGGGYAEAIPESSMGMWQERVIQMLKAALTPSRLQCEVEISHELAAKTTKRQVCGHIMDFPSVIQAPCHIPVLNTFSHFQLYFMLECGFDLLPATITVSARTDKGEKFTVQLPLQKATDQTAIHHLAAKALIYDYETGNSWFHAQNTSLMAINPALFGRILKQQAEILGQTWSITSKWTSYVAIDRANAQRREIAVRKADSIEISRLAHLHPASFGSKRFLLDATQDTANRTSKRAREAFMVRSRPQGHIGWGSHTKGKGEYVSMDMQCAPVVSMDMQCAPVQHSASPGIKSNPPSEILMSQTANGKFNLDEFKLRDFLGADHESLVLEQYLSSMCEENADFASIRLNILVVVHIKNRYATSKSLWELQIEKARRWIKEMMRILWKDDSSDRRPTLEILESLMAKELHERDLQKDQNKNNV